MAKHACDKFDAKEQVDFEKFLEQSSLFVSDGDKINSFTKQLEDIGNSLTIKAEKYNLNVWQEETKINGWNNHTVGVCKKGCKTVQNKFSMSLVRHGESNALKISDGLKHIEKLHPNKYKWMEKLSKIYIKSMLNLC